MLCRAVLWLAAVSYLICVLWLSGLQKEDLDVNMLRKLQRYDVNISDIGNGDLRECLGTKENTDDKAVTEHSVKDYTETTIPDIEFDNETNKSTEKERTYLTKMLNNIIEMKINYDSGNIKNKSLKRKPENTHFRSTQTTTELPRTIDIKIKDEDLIPSGNKTSNDAKLNSILKFWNMFSSSTLPDETTRIHVTSQPKNGKTNKTTEDFKDFGFVSNFIKNFVREQMKSTDYIQNASSTPMVTETIPTTVLPMIDLQNISLQLNKFIEIFSTYPRISNENSFKKINNKIANIQAATTDQTIKPSNFIRNVNVEYPLNNDTKNNKDLFSQLQKLLSDPDVMRKLAELISSINQESENKNNYMKNKNYYKPNDDPGETRNSNNISPLPYLSNRLNRIQEQSHNYDEYKNTYIKNINDFSFYTNQLQKSLENIQNKHNSITKINEEYELKGNDINYLYNFILQNYQLLKSLIDPNENSHDQNANIRKYDLKNKLIGFNAPLPQIVSREDVSLSPIALPSRNVNNDNELNRSNMKRYKAFINADDKNNFHSSQLKFKDFKNFVIKYMDIPPQKSQDEDPNNVDKYMLTNNKHDQVEKFSLETDPNNFAKYSNANTNNYYDLDNTKRLTSRFTRKPLEKMSNAGYVLKVTNNEAHKQLQSEIPEQTLNADYVINRNYILLKNGQQTSALISKQDHESQNLPMRDLQDYISMGNMNRLPNNNMRDNKQVRHINTSMKLNDKDITKLLLHNNQLKLIAMTDENNQTRNNMRNVNCDSIKMLLIKDVHNKHEYVSNNCVPVASDIKEHNVDQPHKVAPMYGTYQLTLDPTKHIERPPYIFNVQPSSPVVHKSTTKPDESKVFSKDMINEIAENIKAMVLKDLHEKISTITTSSITTTVPTIISTSTLGTTTLSTSNTKSPPPLTDALEFNNTHSKSPDAGHVLEKFMELFEQLKTMKDKSPLINDTAIKTLHRHVPAPLEMYPYRSINIAEMRPYDAGTFNSQPAQDFSDQIKPGTPSMYRSPETNSRQRLSSPPIVQMDVGQILPLAIPVAKPLELVHQNIIVTTSRPAEQMYNPNSFLTYRGNRDDRSRDYVNSKLTNVDQIDTGSRPEYSHNQKYRSPFAQVHQYSDTAKDDADGLREYSYKTRTNSAVYPDVKKHEGRDDYEAIKREHRSGNRGNQNRERFHERLEKSDENRDHSGALANRYRGYNTHLHSRQQQPLNDSRKPSGYDDTHFKNFLQTQQKVNEMLEKILASQTRAAPHSVETL